VSFLFVKHAEIGSPREWEGMNWIHLVQDIDKWPALNNTIMNT
jgi:hypothetical protein